MQAVHSGTGLTTTVYVFSGKSPEAIAASASEKLRKPIRVTIFMLLVSQHPIIRRAQASFLGLKPVPERCCVVCWGTELDAAEACARSVPSVLAQGLQQVAWLFSESLLCELRQTAVQSSQLLVVLQLLVSSPEHGS